MCAVGMRDSLVFMAMAARGGRGSRQAYHCGAPAARPARAGRWSAARSAVAGGGGPPRARRALVVLEGYGHYEVYVDPAFAEVMDETVAWFREHLPPR